MQQVLTHLPADFPVPIVLIQHMPATFTPAFANRLNALCSITVKEAEEGDILKPATAYLAPGGQQMTLKKRGGSTIIHIEPGKPDLTYKPSIDITFNSIAEIYSNEVLAIVLTGMGADGCEGAKNLHSHGCPIWAQDEASSVVYGMPAAVTGAGITEKVLPISSISNEIIRRI